MSFYTEGIDKGHRDERTALKRSLRAMQKAAHNELEIAIYGQVIQMLLERGKKEKRK